MLIVDVYYSIQNKNQYKLIFFSFLIISFSRRFLIDRPKQTLFAQVNKILEWVFGRNNAILL
jgi:hypothetical protein